MAQYAQYNMPTGRKKVFGVVDYICATDYIFHYIITDFKTSLFIYTIHKLIFYSFLKSVY